MLSEDEESCEQIVLRFNKLKQRNGAAMKFLKTLTIILTLSVCGWIIPQNISAQTQSMSGYLVPDELSSYRGSQSTSAVWIPCLYPGSRQNLSNMSLKGSSAKKYINVNKNESTVPQPAEDNIPAKFLLIPNDDKRIESDRVSVYKFNLAVDIPVVAVGTVWSVYALSKIYTKTPPSVADVQSLNKNNIPFFDRWAVYPYDKNLDKVSYYPFYASIPLPLIFFLSTGETSKDFFKLGFLYWETLSVMGLLGTSSTYFVDRYRPYTYTNSTPMDVRTNKVARNSFFSGHAEMIAAPTFLIAKVYSDYYPESNIKWFFYGFATTITTATSYLRLKSGEHFPSDIILGAVVGALAGILVPEFHRNQNSDVSVLPYSNEMAKGVTLMYQF